MSYPRYYQRYPQPYGGYPQYRRQARSSPENAIGLVMLLLFCGWFLVPVLLAAGLVTAFAVYLFFCGLYLPRVLYQFFNALLWSLHPQHRPEGLAGPKRTAVKPDDGEPAMLGYFGGQVSVDRRYMTQLCFGRLGYLLRVERTKLWRSADTWATVLRLPISVGRFLALLTAFVLGVPVVLLLLAVHLAVVGCFVAAARAARVLLRGGDRTLLKLRRIRMSCPFCYERIEYPAYACTGCEQLHRDIRPGRYGVLRRVCACGARLPTLLLLGSSRKLRAVCPACEQWLDHRPGEAKEFVLPLFGAAGAGKSRLMAGIHSVLQRGADRPGSALEYADTDTQNFLRNSSMMLRPQDRTSATPRGWRPRGLPVRLRAGRRTLLLQLFDAAGENFYQTKDTEPLTYLGKAYTFLLVIDPLAIQDLWSALAEHERSRLSGYRSQNPDKELAYQQTYQQIESQYTRDKTVLKKARIAVVLTRADLLEGTSVARPADQPVPDWARETLGLGNLLQSIENNFGDWAVFQTAAVTDDSGNPSQSLCELLDWVLRKEAKEFRDALGTKFNVLPSAADPEMSYES